MSKKSGDGVEKPADLFDLDRLRISQTFADAVGVKKVLTTVPVQRPNRQWFVRVRPEASFRMPVAVLESQEDRLTYLLVSELAEQLPAEVASSMLFTAMNRQGTLFLWPIKLSPDGRRNSWTQSAMEAAERAQRRWVRVAANMDLGAYELFEATADLPEPVWPELSFKEILEIAFRERLIETYDHPVLCRLRGEA